MNTIEEKINEIVGRHGTEAGDDPAFDELVKIAKDLVWRLQYIERWAAADLIEFNGAETDYHRRLCDEILRTGKIPMAITARNGKRSS